MAFVHCASLPSIYSHPSISLLILSFVLKAKNKIYLILIKPGILFLVLENEFVVGIVSSKPKFCLLSCNFLCAVVERILAVH